MWKCMRVVSVRVCGRECEHGYVLVRTVELIELINAHLKPFSEFFHRPIKGSRSLLYILVKFHHTSQK